MQASALTGIILAGGLSSRMGTDKARLSIQGESLLNRSRRILVDAGCDRVILSGAPREEWPDQTINDLVPRTGPVGGMVSCLLELQQAVFTELIFVAVDTPLLSPTLIQRLLSVSASADAVLYQQHPLPLRLRLTPAVLARAHSLYQALCADQDCSVRAFIAPLQIVQLIPSDAEASQLLNINTPQAWDNLQHELTH